MSLVAYFGRPARETRVPHGRGLGLGIRVDGAVAEGRISLEERMKEVALRSVRVDSRYERVSGCDPVLASHLGVEPAGE